MALAPDDSGGTERSTAIRLVTAHRSGDETAFAEIVRTHYTTLLSCARRRLCNTEDAEDAVQEAFLRAYRRLGSFGTEGDWRLGAWLNTIVSNVCTDMLVRRKPSSPFDEWNDGRPDDRPETVDLVSDHVVFEAVADAIATLPQSQRSAFLLRMVDDRPYDEVAAALGITEDNARARVARARSALQRALSRSEALSGMLAAVPLLVAGSLRSALRKVFSNAGDSAHATAVSALSVGSANASAEVATVTGGPISSSMQLLGQLAAAPVAQAAFVAGAAGGSGRGSAVLGVVASLAAAGSLTVPAVVSSGGSNVPRVALHLTSAISRAPAPSGGSGRKATSPSSSASSSSAAQLPAAPSWVALAASAAVDGASATAGVGSSAPGGAGTAGTLGGTGASSSTPAPPATTVSLPVGSCTTVAGFTGVTAPQSVPTLGSDALDAILSTGNTALTSSVGSPAFDGEGSMMSAFGSTMPAQVRVGTCLAAGGSILAVDMTGSTGDEVQLVGSLVSPPEQATSTATYLFRGGVTQIAGAQLSSGLLPWNLSSSFVAELQVTEPAASASLTVAFLEAISPPPTGTSGGVTSAGSRSTTGPGTTSGGSGKGSGRSAPTTATTTATTGSAGTAVGSPTTGTADTTTGAATGNPGTAAVSTASTTMGAGSGTSLSLTTLGGTTPATSTGTPGQATTSGPTGAETSE